MHTLCRRSRPWHMRAGVALLLALIVSPFVAPFGPVGMACADDGEGGGDQERASKSVDPEARRLYEQALIHFKAGALDEAIQKLQAAFLLAPAPELLYDLGQAYRLKGDCARALDFYRRFLACDPEGAALERAQVRKSEMEKCAAADAGAVDPSTAKPTAPSSTPPSTPLLADAPLAGDLPSTPPSSSVAVTIAIPPLVQARNTTPEKAPSRWRRNRPALAMAVFGQWLLRLACASRIGSGVPGIRPGPALDRGGRRDTTNRDVERPAGDGQRNPWRGRRWPSSLALLA